MKPTIYSIGHSNHSIEQFLSLLHENAIEAIADVRSHPYSRFAPQYTQKALAAALADAGIGYLFLGHELGARSADPACYRDGRVQYGLLAQTPEFARGIEQVEQAAEQRRIALMCAEKDPLDCHRALLVGRKLFELGSPVCHIHANNELESHEELESRMLVACKLPPGDMFRDRDEFVALAYAMRSGEIAYEASPDNPL